MATRRMITHPEARTALDRIMGTLPGSVPLPIRASAMIDRVFSAEKPLKPLTVRDVNAAFDRAISTMPSNDYKTIMEALRNRLIAVLVHQIRRELSERIATEGA